MGGEGRPFALYESYRVTTRRSESSESFENRGAGLPFGTEGSEFKSSRPDHNSNPREPNFLGNCGSLLFCAPIFVKSGRPLGFDRVTGVLNSVLLHHHDRPRALFLRPDGFRTTRSLPGGPR